MKTPAELLTDLHDTLAPMEDDYRTINDYAVVMQSLTEELKVCDSNVPGIYRLLGEIIQRVEHLLKKHAEAIEIARRLAKP